MTANTEDIPAESVDYSEEADLRVEEEAIQGDPITDDHFISINRESEIVPDSESNQHSVMVAPPSVIIQTNMMRLVRSSLILVVRVNAFTLSLLRLLHIYVHDVVGRVYSMYLAYFLTHPLCSYMPSAPSPQFPGLAASPLQHNTEEGFSFMHESEVDRSAYN